VKEGDSHQSNEDHWSEAIEYHCDVSIQIVIKNVLSLQESKAISEQEE
jgi:hypothetical protein